MTQGESLHIQNFEGVEMIIAIDSTARGPALGGCRWKLYPTSDAARADARALASAMTRKAALARLSLGGGKAVVAGDARARTPEQLREFGRFVDSLGGKYITAADMGTGEQEMVVIRETTSHVAGLPMEAGGCGDPGPFTARGVLLAMRGALEHCDKTLAGARVAIQGVGSVGAEMANLLLAEGADVIVADTNRDRLKELPDSVRVVAPDAIAYETCDIFAPSGPPGVIDERVARELNCSIVCGAANNPLAQREVARTLQTRGILYVPDYLGNAGGLIHLAVALEGGDAKATLKHLEVIPENLAAVLERAKADNADMATTADRMARELVPN
jgi:leucine dehydrogenase